MVRKKTRLAILRLAHSFGAKVRFIKSDESGSYYHCIKTIHISKTLKKTCQQLLSTCCHEIGHLIAYHKRKFPKFHHLKSVSRLTTAERIAAKRTAFRAERYVDKLGAALFKENFPQLRYEKSYTKKKDRQWLREYLAALY